MEVESQRGMMVNGKVQIFKYSGYLLPNQNSIQQEIKCRFKARNLCYCSVQILFVISISLEEFENLII